MIYLHNHSHNPYFNLALEEYLLKQQTEDFFLTWRNAPTVVVGKNQQTEAEVNIPYVKANQINVVRRLSGGGAVYHDLQNLNFTYIINTKKSAQDNMEQLSIPILGCLHTLGLPAELSGRNDILLNGKKVSGSAQYHYQNRLIHHGTLLFNSDLSILDSILHIKKSYAQKGIASVLSRVTNIASCLEAPLSIEDFEQLIMQAVFHRFPPFSERLLTEAEQKIVQTLAETKYALPEWTYSGLPKHTFSQIKTFPGGTIAVYLNIEQEIIQHCRIYGDFLTTGPLEIIEQKLANCPYTRESIRARITENDIQSVFLNISLSEFLSCFKSESPTNN